MERNIFLIFLSLSLINILSASEINEGHCPLVFNVKKYHIKEISKVDSYFVNFNITSIDECAKFCGKRHFCRTADYNPIEKSCSISYKETLNCYTNYERFSSYQIDTKRIDKYIYRISCANYCDSKFNSNPHSHEKTQEYKDAINSINGNEEFGKYLNKIPEIILELQRKLGSDTKIHTQLIPVERKIEEKIREIDHKNGSLTRQVQKVETEIKEVKGQLIKMGQLDGEIEEKVKGIIEYVEKDNDKEVNVLSDNLSKSFDNDIVNKIPTMKSFRVVSDDVPLPIQRYPKMRGVRTEVRGDSITFDLPNEPVVINGRVVGYQEKSDKDGNSVDVFYNSKEYNSHEFTYSSKENIDANNAVEYCYRVINEQELMYAGYKTLEQISLNECRCACAESWLTMNDPVCLSIQYFKETSKCILNKGDHHGRYDLVYNPKTVYYHTSCTREVFLSTVKSICNFTLGSPKDTTTLAPINDNNSNVKSDKDEKEEVDSIMVSSKKTSDECFEVIPGYNMIGVTGGMESNVTLEECKCFCAHGKTLNRHKFQCLSATYFHDQRDCLLNIADKEIKPKGFVKNYAKNYRVSYIGMTCPFSKYLTDVFEDFNLHKCRIDDYEERKNNNNNSEEEEVLDVKTKNTDDCFTEMPSYVLEGTAMALETNVTIDECKCYCIDSENRYGIICQSLQYYYDSSTCLLNNENKDSNPEKFSHNRLSDTSHSYFHFSCHSQKIFLSSYVEQTCTNILDQKLPKVELKDEMNKKVDGDLSHDSRLSYSDINKHDKEDKIIQLISNDEIKKHVITSTPNNYLASDNKMINKEESKVPKTSNKPVLETFTQSPNNGNDNANYEENEKTFENNEIDLDDSEEDDNEITTTTTEYPLTTVGDSSETEITTTTGTDEESLTKPLDNIGPCSYNALYNRLFNGNKLIKRVEVDSAVQCFKYCHINNCRSANLMLSTGSGRICELYKDSIVDYRRSDILEFARGGAHFDTIKCQVKGKISN